MSYPFLGNHFLAFFKLLFFKNSSMIYLTSLIWKSSNRWKFAAVFMTKPHLKVARGSLGRYHHSLIINNYHKLRRHWQRFRKNTTTAVQDKDENDIGVIVATKWQHCLFYLQPYFLAWHWEVFYQNCLRGLFLPIAAATFVKFKQNAFEICACRNVSFCHENMNYGDNTPFSWIMSGSHL